MAAVASDRHTADNSGPDRRIRRPYLNQRDNSYPDAHDFKGGQSDQGDEDIDRTVNAPSEEH